MTESSFSPMAAWYRDCSPSGSFSSSSSSSSSSTSLATSMSSSSSALRRMGATAPTDMPCIILSSSLSRDFFLASSRSCLRRWSSGR
uniref:Uncharacterized protein n=1 Tax=Bionectria ochroleuca TaxID=29856 RepID=A0A0B7KMF4_BIOOC